jgi:hypothetical protein
VTIKGPSHLERSFIGKSQSLGLKSDVQIYCTRKCTNRLQYNGVVSARLNPQGIVFFKAKFKSKLI